jgi:hypothetical protein
VPEYPRHLLVKHVTDAGTFRFQQHLFYIANALVDQWIGLEKTDDGVWSIYFDTVVLATLDERDFRRPRVTPTKCYLCPRTSLLPISPAAQTTRNIPIKPATL